MVSKFYKFVDAGDTEGAISCVKKIPNVNMLDKCRPLYNMEGILLQYSTTEGDPLYYAIWKKADASVIEALLMKGADERNNAGTEYENTSIWYESPFYMKLIASFGEVFVGAHFLMTSC